MTIAENIAHVREEIEQAAKRCGRNSDEITLVAASKMNNAARVREAIDAGISVCGENRVQEMTEKNSQGAYKGAHLHFIGRLQRNKVKQVVGIAELIHGVDTLALLQEIGRRAAEKGIVQDVLLEVNIGREKTKAGFAPEEIPTILENGETISGIRIRGLMAIPPIVASEAEIFPYFSAMQQLFIDNGQKKYDNSNMDFLSMGMSNDFQQAIACGSNMIRIGTKIFGPRS
jgi:hypothetical protein